MSRITSPGQAWRDGYYAGKRDYAASITGGVSISSPNPYEGLAAGADVDRTPVPSCPNCEQAFQYCSACGATFRWHEIEHREAER